MRVLLCSLLLLVGCNFESPMSRVPPTHVRRIVEDGRTKYVILNDAAWEKFKNEHPEKVPAPKKILRVDDELPNEIPLARD